PPPSAASEHRQGVALVFGCTLLGAAAQILLKTGANHMAQITLLNVITNWALIGGLSLYCVSTVLLVLALRDGELSLLYPVIALTYVWVTILSVAVFHESMNVFKLAGVTVIVAGVAVLGMGEPA